MSEKKKNFIALLSPYVRDAAARTGLDPRLILAQSALETGWGGKAPGHNYFGIKSHNREGGQNLTTTEYVGGAPVKKVQSFREYSGPKESIQDYANFILQNPRYQEAMRAKSIEDQIKAIGNSGYATDPRYGKKLKAVALGIELPPEPPPENKPVVQEQRPVEQKEQVRPTEQPPPQEQEAEAVNYNQTDPRDEPVAFADGGFVDNFIPHDDPRHAKNLAAFHGKTPNEIKNTRWYHGTRENFGVFRKGKSKAIFVSPDPEFASFFANDPDRTGGSPNVMPVHVRAENPFDYENPEHFNQLFKNLEPISKNMPSFRDTIADVKRGEWYAIEDKNVQNAIKSLGHDSFFVRETDESGEPSKNLAVYNPEQIKSATGNNGNFDATEQDINKADGGEVDDQPEPQSYAHENDLLQPIGQSRLVGDEKPLFDEGVYKAGVSGFSMNNRKSIRYLHHDENDNPIGALQIMTEGPRSKKAVVQNVYVAEPFRRSKIATGLLKRARQDYDVRHSADLTNAGRSFAKAVKKNGGSANFKDFALNKLEPFEFETPPDPHKGVGLSREEIISILNQKTSGTEPSPRMPEEIANQGRLGSGEIERLSSSINAGAKAPNIALLGANLGNGNEARGRVLQSGQYVDIGGGVTIPVKDYKLMLDASAGKVRGTSMTPNTSVRAGFSVPFSTGGGVDDQQQRELSPLGFYSHAAEMSSQLPQERGSPQQMAGMLTNKYGVKPVEMEGFNEAFANRPSVTRDELTQYFNERRPQVEETVLSGKRYGEVREQDDGTFAIQWEDGTFSGGYGSDGAAYQAMEDRSRATKFQQYTLPGGENYREILLTASDPQGSRAAIGRKYNSQIDELTKNHQALNDEVKRLYADRAPGNDFIRAKDSASDAYFELRTLKEQRDKELGLLQYEKPFTSTHYPDPNILAHLRMSDRTGSNGEKILHLEEIQSDWGQKGKKEGFDTPEMRAKMLKELPEGYTVRLEEYQRTGDPERYGVFNSAGVQVATGYGRENTINSALNSLNEAIRGTSASPVPTAPYVTTTAAWTDLALKRALKEAAEGGYDRLVWTPGAEQAKRYDLSKQVRRVDYDPKDQYLAAWGVNQAEGVGPELLQKVPPEKLADHIGKETAEKLLGSQTSKTGRHSLTGLDLQVGGKGMIGYYDKIVPTQLSKLLKKLDPEAKIEMGRLPVEGRNKGSEDIARELGMTFDQIYALPDAERRALVGSVRNTISAPSLTITPKMREAIKRGLPAYADGGAVDDDDEGLTAYHGSPYDFPQFDTSKIGTGEGAQAYGHGLYFAESEPVAKEYRDKLTAGTYKGDTGKVFDPFDDLEHMNVRVAAYKSIDNAIDRAKGLLEDYPNSDAIKRDLAKLMEAKAQNATPQTGHMYEVKINAHPDHFLDWDKPLNEQSEHVQNAIKSIASSVDVDPFEHLALAASIGKHPRSQDYSPRGNDLYTDLEEIIGDKTKVSDLLYQNGLKGIKYLDERSRGTARWVIKHPQGGINEFADEASAQSFLKRYPNDGYALIPPAQTRNYVVFNHDHVQVKRKYAQGGAIAGAEFVL